MTRHEALATLFSSLLLACSGPDAASAEGSGSGSSGETSSGSTSSTDEPNEPSEPSGTPADDRCDSEEMWTELIPSADVESVLDEEGNVLPAACYGLCGVDGEGEQRVRCSILTPQGEGTGSTTGSDTDDGVGTSGSSTGTDSSGSSGGDALVEVQCDSWWECLGGRGHAALLSDGRAHASDPIGHWAARCAHAEAASVPAFVGLARELEAHGAPRQLRSRALQAAREEVTHAAMMERIAHERGARVQEPRFERMTIRDLEAIATENAVEGCVRETWAALEASYQRRHARSAKVRAAMDRIADDETSHAELARDIDAWCRTRLDAEARARVDAARDAAVARLMAHRGTAIPEAVRLDLGLPSRAQAEALKRGLRDRLWS